MNDGLFSGLQTFFESAEPIDKQAQEKDEEEEEQIGEKV